MVYVGIVGLGRQGRAHLRSLSADDSVKVTCYLDPVRQPDLEQEFGIRWSPDLTTLCSGDSPVDVGRRAGRRRRLGSTDVFDPVAELADQMARQGFDPTVRQRGDDIDVTLRTCPFATTALADPDTVCGLHLGIAYGIADSVDGLVVDELIPKDPRRAHCRLHCHVESQTVRKDP